MSQRKIKTFFIRTFGCQMNEHDSQRMRNLLVSHGLRPAESDREADLVIVNSCSVRAKPEHKALSEAGRYQRERQNKGMKVVLAGCVAQQSGKQILRKAPYIDGIMGTDAVVRLPQLLAQLQEGKGPVIDVSEHDEANPCFVPPTPTDKPGISAQVTIMKGCNNFCSYCIVPYVRGREASKPCADILAEVEQLAHAGCREVFLLGQNVNSYHDPSGMNFAQLLQAIDQQAAVDRIRFISSHPKDLSPSLIDAMAKIDRVCEHIHLGLQSGADRILRLMNRGYDAGQFLEKALALREQVPGVSITTDIIVGFPSETDRDFQDTLEVVSKIGFDQAFSFKYSPRPGTAAASMPDDVAEPCKAERLATLQDLLGKLGDDSLARLCGRSHTILVEKPAARSPEALSGRTRCNRVVNFEPKSGTQVGNLAQVTIAEVRGHTLWGKEEPEPLLRS